MNRLISSAVAATALFCGATAFAQASNFDQYQQNRAAEAAQIHGAYGNSGWTPDMAYGDNHNLYPFGYSRYGYAEPVYRDRRGDRHGRVATRRDRDGDGVANRDDRYPDNPRRW
jgi:hypothetical protein